MHRTTKTGAAIAAVAWMASVVQATPLYVDWTSFTPSSSSGAGDGSAVGILDFDGDIVHVSYAGDVYSGGGLTTTVSDHAPYYSNPGLYSPASPGLTDNISNDGGADSVHTLTFDRPVTNPHFHVVSMGQPGLTVDWVFNHDFTVVSGTVSRSAPNTLRGAEQNGSINFVGDFTQISWTTPIFENTTGFQFSVDAIAIPEPATMALFAVGATVLLRPSRLRAAGRVNLSAQ
jgi:hypothetical protein